MPGGPGCVYLGNLSYRAHESDVEKLLSRFGKLRYVSLKSKYGFAEFEDSRDADDAVYDLNGKELFGDRLIVEHARGPGRGRDRDDRFGGSYRGGPPSRRGGGGGGFDRLESYSLSEELLETN